MEGISGHSEWTLCTCNHLVRHHNHSTQRYHADTESEYCRHCYRCSHHRYGRYFYLKSIYLSILFVYFVARLVHCWLCPLLVLALKLLHKCVQEFEFSLLNITSIHLALTACLLRTPNRAIVVRENWGKETVFSLIFCRVQCSLSFSVLSSNFFHFSLISFLFAFDF